MKKLLLAFALGVLFSATFNLTELLKPDSYTLRTVTAHSGDTLWVLAARNCSADEDVRDVISRIMEANGLENAASLRAGQKIVIPVLNTHDSETGSAVATAAGRR